MDLLFFILFVFENRQKITFNLFSHSYSIHYYISINFQRSNHLSRKTYAIVMKKLRYFQMPLNQKKSNLLVLETK